MSGPIRGHDRRDWTLRDRSGTNLATQFLGRVMHTPPCRFVIAPDVNTGVVMTLLATYKGPGQGRIHWCVSDRGIGIPQDKLETMF